MTIERRAGHGQGGAAQALRRGAPHLALSIEDLQRVMTPSWGAVERAALGDWALRASAGYTQRGNSVVPVGSPGTPLADAVEATEPGMPRAASQPSSPSPGRQGFDPADDPLGALLLEPRATRRAASR